MYSPTILVFKPIVTNNPTDKDVKLATNEIQSVLYGLVLLTTQTKAASNKKVRISYTTRNIVQKIGEAIIDSKQFIKMLLKALKILIDIKSFKLSFLSIIKIGVSIANVIPNANKMFNDI